MNPGFSTRCFFFFSIKETDTNPSLHPETAKEREKNLIGWIAKTKESVEEEPRTMDRECKSTMCIGRTLAVGKVLWGRRLGSC